MAKQKLLSLKEFADAIGTSQTYVSNLTAEPKIVVTMKNNRKYIDISKYPVEKFKKQGT